MEKKLKTNAAAPADSVYGGVYHRQQTSLGHVLDVILGFSWYGQSLANRNHRLRTDAVKYLWSSRWS